MCIRKVISYFSSRYEILTFRFLHRHCSQRIKQRRHHLAYLYNLEAGTYQYISAHWQYRSTMEVCRTYCTGKVVVLEPLAELADHPFSLRPACRLRYTSQITLVMGCLSIFVNFVSRQQPGSLFVAGVCAAYHCRVEAGWNQRLLSSNRTVDIVAHWCHLSQDCYSKWHMQISEDYGTGDQTYSRPYPHLLEHLLKFSILLQPSQLLLRCRCTWLWSVNHF